MNIRQLLNEQHEIASFLGPNDFSDFDFIRKSSLRDLIPTLLFTYLEFSVSYFNDQNLILKFRAFLLSKAIWNRTVQELDYIIGNTVANKINFLNEIYADFFEDLKKVADKLSISKDFSEKNVLFHIMKIITVDLEFNIVIFNKNRRKLFHKSADSYFCIPIFRRKGNFYVLYPSNPQYLQNLYANTIEKKDKLFMHCGHHFEPNRVSSTNISCKKCNERLYSAEIKISYPEQNKKDIDNSHSYEEKKVYRKVEPHKNQNQGLDGFNKAYKCSDCHKPVCLYCSVSNKNYNEVHKKSTRPSGNKCRYCKKGFNKEMRGYIKKLADHARNIGMQDEFHLDNYCIENFISKQ
ncbi:unnamed protein product [Blepharisma stoltei]|uniref:B box-type domain-containing protein n=1 Tax=Blepharisma stoltei TaxID=1481888 RepID=A0AAU9IY49_9CILI|nr:unnamed protein product [Blepharisma stoltei]